MQSAARAVRILRLLFLAPEGKQLAEVSAEVGLHKSTTLRLLRTLRAEGVVHQEARGGRYRIHPLTWVMVVTRVLPQLRLVEAVEGALEELAEKTGATAMLVFPVVGGRSVAATSWAVPKRVLRLDPDAAGEAPMHACAPGKCYLAALPEAELRAWLRRRLPKLTKHTITSAAKLAKELAVVRSQGHAVDREEFVLGGAGLATPVTDASGHVSCVLSLALPAHEMTEETVARWLPLVKSVASRLSQTLGIGGVRPQAGPAGGGAEASPGLSLARGQ